MLDVVRNFLRLVPEVKSTIEVGAYNVNGTARDVIRSPVWVGVDKRSGPCVDLVRDVEADGLPFSDGAFDCSVCVETLEHCEQWFRVLSEIWRCTRVGGVCAVTTPSPGFAKHDFPNDFWRFTLANWIAVFDGQFPLAMLQYPYSCGIIVTKINDKPLRAIGYVAGVE